MPPAPASLAATLARYARVYAALWRNSVARELAFKSNFLLWIVVEILWFTLQLTFINVIYLQTERIGDWTRWHVVLLIGASQFIQQLFQAFFLTNCSQLSELVRTGKLDFLLLLPLNTRFIVSLRQVDLGGFFNAGVGAAVMAYALHQLHLAVSPLQIFGFLCVSVIGVTIHYSLMLLLAAICFWTVQAQGIVWGYYNLFNVARLPDEAFHGFFRVFFTFAIPMLLVSNVPARVLLAKLDSPWPILQLVLMGAGCVLISEWGWRRSLRRYTSASS